MAARPTAAALAVLRLASARETYTDNPVCVRNNCVHPVFPGMEDLHELSQTTFYCTSMQDTALALDFCKGAVNYDIGVPRPTSKAEESIEALVRKQDRAANTAFMYHLAGLGKDGWDYPNPEESDDDCAKSIWRMVCYTYFPRAKAGCKLGSEIEYIRPCKSGCQNYIKSCGVECCDESVQCVFTHEKQLTKTTVLATSGYEPHDGPSSLCTGSAQRSRSPGLLTALLALCATALGLRPSARLLSAAAVLAALTVSLQGCDEVPTHSVANWRQQEDYLVRYQFVPPGASSKEAILNSCSMSGLSPMVQCSGHGGCHAWDKSADSNPTPFCKCDAGYADPECRTRRRSQAKAYFLALFLGVVGADRFYLGLTHTAWLKFITLGSTSIYWITELLITGSPPVQLVHDIRSWQGLLKIMIFFALGSWYFIDVIRTGSSQVDTSSFRTAPDLPHKVFVASSVFSAMFVGFLVAYWNILAQVASKRKNLWLMQQAYTQERASLDEGVLTQGNIDAAKSGYGSF